MPAAKGRSSLSNIVIATFGLVSLSNVALELSRRLREVGHRVTFVCPAAVADRFSSQGETVVALQHDDRFERLVNELDRPSPLAPRAAVRWVQGRRRLRADSFDVSEVGDAVEGLRPDLVVLDLEFHTAALATEHLDVPRALITNLFSVFNSPGLPPLSSSLPAPAGVKGQYRQKAAWAWVRAGALYQRVVNSVGPAALVATLRPMRLDTVYLRDLAPAARKLGVDLAEVTDRGQWLRPYIAADLPVLCCQAVELELPHTPSPRLRYIGPLIRADRQEPDLAPAERRRWDDLVAARRSAGPDRRRPLVYASLGTMWAADRSLLDRLIAAVASTPDRDLVLGLGGGLDPVELGSLPPNVIATAWAPQLEMLDEADVVVTHGGSGTIVESVTAGVPLVVYSTGFVDQDGNARRVAHHKLGVMGDAADPPELISRAIDRALTDPAIAVAVEAMGAVFHAYQERNEAVAAVEQLIDCGGLDRA
jgi:UDP:flavonoid glycosyltransferase YjiC (YdhE family)